MHYGAIGSSPKIYHEEDGIAKMGMNQESKSEKLTHCIFVEILR